MYYTFLSDKEREMVDKIRDRDTMPFLRHQLKNPMREETKASVAVGFGLASRATLFTQEMGLGKTYVAMGLIENILRRNPNKKVLFCGTNDKLKEYVETFRENLSPFYKVVDTTGAEADCIAAFRQINDAHVLICTHSVWDSGHAFHKEFIPMLDEFQAFLVDEPGMLLKNDDNYAYRMMVEFVPKMEFRYGFNATPIEKDLSLLVNQCRVLGIPIPSKSKLYSQYGKLEEGSDYRFIFGNLDKLKDQLKYHVFNVSRAELYELGKGQIEYKLNEYLLEPTNEQYKLVNEYGNKYFRFPFNKPEMFNPIIYPSLQKLIEICMKGKMEGHKMIVFVLNVEPKSHIKRILEMMGLTVGIYDGSHTPTAESKDRVSEEFEEGLYDVLLTNKIYGLSLNRANHVVMYDLPSNFYQFMFRAVRDLNNQELHVSVIVYNTENDFLTIKSQVDLERHDNEFSDRKFYIVKTLFDRICQKSSYF